ncbi:MAG: hypothetical protein HOF95_03750 [Rhodospirillales bacterium]|jgi:hypothetical protein|nr:hypothetical protein [Rhodospirillales bacterium]MBT4006895.1 hypothetical protein [Rhodospirillales bacterium]MBT5075440.1 hypothetical protein [Rhodospirillales bacterium]MBT5113078.1 hypothetical protein [Rhodospirillales bacterium]MBT6187631.1 hypothetical protein [Rhodospirillales bacterium]
MDGVTQIVFAPLVDWAIIITLGGAGAVVAAYAAWQGARGWGLRTLAMAALIALLANPSIREEKREPLSDIAVVVVDESPSQNIGPRREHAEAALNHIKKMTERDSLLEIRVVRAGKPRAISKNDAGAATQIPKDRGTRLFEALSRVMGDIPPDRFAGAVMITDGQVHDVPKSATTLPFPAPLHTVLTGTRNVNDRRLVVERAAGFGIVNEAVTLTLRIEESGKASGRARVTITRDGKKPRDLDLATGFSHSIELTVDHGGPNVFEIAVAPAAGELTLANNRAAVVVNGIRDRLRVLLISGLPHAGERVWRNLLKADPSVDLVHFTILRPPEKQDGTPVNELSLIAFPTRELFEEKLDDFNLIIFDRYHRRGVLPVNYLHNIVKYVRNGGAILEAGGPALATPLGLFRTPLRTILPLAPTGRVFKRGFRAEITPLGRRHPVTANLGGHKNNKAKPQWGRWFRLVEAKPLRGSVVMQGLNNQPVLSLDRVGKGRIAQLLTDHIWLWARGFEGGGPQAELLRRTAHWLMKEPDLEENDLRASILGTQLSITRRSLKKNPSPVTIIKPSGKRETKALKERGDGRATTMMTINEPGLYRITDKGGKRVVFAAAGTLNPLEFSDVTTSPKHLAPLAKATKSGILWAADGMPDIRRPKPGRALHGRGWLGLRANGDYIVRGVNEIPLAPALLALLLALGLMIAAWRREGN